MNVLECLHVDNEKERYENRGFFQWHYLPTVLDENQLVHKTHNNLFLSSHENKKQTSDFTVSITT